MQVVQSAIAHTEAGGHPEAWDAVELDHKFQVAIAQGNTALLSGHLPLRSHTPGSHWTQNDFAPQFLSNNTL